jgi:hypothetical protein
MHQSLRNCRFTREKDHISLERVSFELVSVAPDHSARFRARMLAAVNHVHTVDEDLGDARRGLARFLKSGVILNRGRIEDGDVCKRSLSQRTTTGNAEIGGGERSHFANGLGYGYEFLVTDVTGIDAGKVAEGAWVRAELEKDAIDALRIGVGTKTDPREDDLLANIVLTHQEINGLHARIVLDY